MQYTEESVRKLLDRLVMPKYEGVIVDYMVDFMDSPDGNTGINIGPILDAKVYEDGYGFSNAVEKEIEDDIKKVLSYLNPYYKMVSFFVEDKSQKKP